MKQKHEESDLQIRCIKWFRYQFPAYARLMEHPKNEGTGDRRRGAIAKAEGVQPGVADLILHVPASFQNLVVLKGDENICVIHDYHSLAIEMKTPKGRQSPEQKEWKQYFEAANGLYVIVRSYDEFVDIVTRYIQNVPLFTHEKITKLHASLQKEADERAKEQFKKIINKK